MPWQTQVALADDKELVETIYTLKRGERLADVARQFYGSPVYDLVIAKHNHIKDKESVAVGTKVRVPDLGDVLVAEGIKTEFMDDVNALVKARYRYMKVHDEIGQVIAAGAARKAVKVPAPVKIELETAASAIETAAKSLAKRGNYTESPSRLKNRLLEAAADLRTIAKGSGDAKLDAKVHVLFAQAWVRAIGWVRGEDGE